MRRCLSLLGMFAVVMLLSGCIVEPAYPDWCYYHPHRC
jgi:hypothetical protein